ncbi:hypothetical protein D0851_01960 [Marinobacter sp. Arc7-DN-1]|nr:hypothetical protein D0851_01960 [Marinobacter sp. Arc7-DN-1]
MKSGIQLDTIAKEWFLVDFTHLGEPMDKRILRDWRLSSSKQKIACIVHKRTHSEFLYLSRQLGP